MQIRVCTHTPNVFQTRLQRKSQRENENFMDANRLTWRRKYLQFISNMYPKFRHINLKLHRILLTVKNTQSSDEEMKMSPSLQENKKNSRLFEIDAVDGIQSYNNNRRPFLPSIFHNTTKNATFAATSHQESKAPPDYLQLPN